MDTGSSDTFVISADAGCGLGTPQKQAAVNACSIAGTNFNPGSSFRIIPDVHLNTSYGGGEYVNGPLGHTDLILGGVTVSNQIVSAASYMTGTTFLGDVSGIAGLAYPTLTSAYPGTNASKDVVCETNSSCGPIYYPSLITTLFEQNSLDPVFAFALSRSRNFGGVFTLGGIPRLDGPFINAGTSNIGSSLIRPYGKSIVLNAYTTQVDSLVYTNAIQDTGRGIYLIDTGTFANIFPKQQADAINTLFDPPAYYNATIGGYVVSCNATPPKLGVNISGQVFYHNPTDMINQFGDVCLSAIGASFANGASARVLGATWLKNVLAIFDVGKSQMTFLSREVYEET